MEPEEAPPPQEEEEQPAPETESWPPGQPFRPDPFDLDFPEDDFVEGEEGDPPDVTGQP